MQLRPIPKELQRLRIGERLLVLHFAPVNHLADGELDDLPALRPRDLRHLHDARRDVARAGRFANAALDRLAKVVRQRETLPKLHEQHDPFVVAETLSNDKALDDRVDLLHLPVDLGGADADTARIQRGVGAAVDDQAVVFGQLGVVPMAPHARIDVEIRLVVLAPVGIVPEARAASRGTASCTPARLSHREPGDRCRRRPPRPCPARAPGSRRATPVRPDCRGRSMPRCRCRPRSTRGARRA